ncbi:DNA translocase FtsK [Alkalihalobacillus deserti]|uniref:DNA translocase FtsK n=1 Tax=Alkalihalobacillus deserti TaxID=2879466 RepID=UPI001D1421E7|nr:DNA translocase FtsK [Alkalihalobacillus deserti]
MEKLYQWMRRLQQLIGGEDSEPKQEIKSSDKKVYTYGRVESEKRKSESKVIYQYPKSGQFRFPLIEDGPVRKHHHKEEKQQYKEEKQQYKEEKQQYKEEKQQSRKVSQNEEKVRPQKQETSKAKTEFKRTLIPSPVYGFGERETTKSIMGDSISVLPFEKKEVQFNTQADLLERVLERAEEDKLEPVFPEKLQLSEDLNRRDSDILPEQNRELISPLAEASMPLIEHKVDETVKDSEIEKEEMKLVEKSQQIGSISKLVETRFSEVVEEVEAEDRAGEILSMSMDTSIDSTNTSHEEEVNASTEKVAAPVIAEKEEKIDTVEKEVVKAGKKSESNQPKKPAIPFNVMMLPQDKKPKPKPEKEVLESNYAYPSIQLLNYPEVQKEDDSEWLREQGDILEETLQSFQVDAKVVHSTKGPSVTRFEVQPGRGVKVTKITGLTDDMKLALAAKDIRIEAPIPGKNTIGIEVPNRSSTPVFLREILRRNSFVRSESSLTVALGLDISGQPIVTDLKKMPHGLVAGATGSGKSVCINSVLISLLFKANPDEVKLMLIDPKMVELAPYNGLPHLVTPVITDAKQATAALKWVVLEMERRYELFSQKGVRDVGRYNDIYSETPDKPALPFILVVIDELADLMMVSPQEVEDSICRIAQKARACGIHLLLATQRPSVDVITGLIKANIPTRIAFSVSSQTDSRTILDMGGAERLLGRGDMLFHENGTPKPVRVQGTFVSDQEIEDVVAHVKKQREPEYLLETEQLKHVSEEVDDEHFEEACYFVIEQGSASASSLQRKFRVGYNRAARLIDLMEERGIVSQAMGSKPRHVLVDTIELEEILHYQEG